jgi:predicted DNA-binding transcriptional regulator AlpA
MTAAPLPRLLTVRDVCRMLRRTSGWFYKHREELEAAGFPKPVPVIGRYDAEAIDAWLKTLRGLDSTNEGSRRSAWAERLRHVREDQARQ